MPGRDRLRDINRRDRRRVNRAHPYVLPLAMREGIVPNNSNLGQMNGECNFCHARHFQGEKTSNGTFTKCCHRGKAVLNIPQMTDVIRLLLTEQDNNSKNYRRNIRAYNSALAMVSAKASTNDLRQGGGPYHFKIHGTFYHGHGPLIPSNEEASYAQLYFYDCEEANRIRLNRAENSNCMDDVMTILSDHLHDVNPYVQSYSQMYRIVRSGQFGDPKDMKMIIVTDPATDLRRYNAPVSTDVAAIFTSPDGTPPGERDLVVYPLNSESATERLSILSSHLDPLAYPLIFPNGDQGWNPSLNFTMLQYAQHRISIRENASILHLSGKLYLQWLVDVYVRIEGTRLQWVRHNQATLRVESYKGLSDHLRTRAEQDNVRNGKCVVLPSTFINSPRNMLAKYNDAMAIVRKYGKPDLFVTVTANPKWHEIEDNLYEGQEAWMRPELVVRVFHQKLKELMSDITDRCIFGAVAAIIYTIEFQKRGLPHCHILISLKEDDKINDLDKVDQAVSAELPDINSDIELYNLVKKHMIHGPCGDLNHQSPCMVNGTCKKNYPREFNERTSQNSSGFPVYRRRDDGATADVRGRTIDNRWVVPYNRYLLIKYQTHINVEVCTTVKSVKYIYKYIYKGYDCATTTISPEGQLDHDEIKSYLDSRWVGSCEACWRILEFEMHYQNHAVIRLDCHLPNEQRVYFREGEEQRAVEFPKQTKLLAWFELNRVDISAHQLLYMEIPEHYKWEQNQWKPRRNNAKVVSRLYTVNPKQTECFFLRLLLLHVKGAQSFEDLLAVTDENTGERIICDSFQQAAIKRGIATNDNHWRETIEEAIQNQMPHQIRHLFAIICAMNVPSNCNELWSIFKESMSEDFRVSMTEEEAYNRTLLEIEDIFLTHNTSCSDLGIPTPTRRVVPQNVSVLEEQHHSFEMMYESANELQRQTIDAIILAIENPQHSNLFFIDAPAGCGKTYIQRTLMYYVRGRGYHCIPVATTGIAASLLEGGHTIHSQFKLPINVSNDSVSGVIPNSAAGQYIRTSKLLIVDEVSSALSEIITVLDRLYRDIEIDLNRNRPFGGHVVLFCGDFRQCLPVIPHGLRATTVEHSAKFNPTWKFVKVFKLNQNMRVNQGEEEFANYLLEVGNGTLPKYDPTKQFSCILTNRLLGIGSPIDFIYSNQDLLSNSIIDTAILCPTNEHCSEINLAVLSKLPSEEHIYYSSDSVKSDDPNEHLKFPTEFLNSIEISGIPRHKLILKVGAIVMLMRNLNTAKGIINGTRMRVVRLQINTIVCIVLTGSSQGREILIPKVKLSPSESLLPFRLERLQFPLTLAFAFTINKAQGQTLGKVAIFLPKPVFSHGQLYVGLSRARSFDQVKVFIKSGNVQKLTQNQEIVTENVVWTEVL
jgi:hypothetical protein